MVRARLRSTIKDGVSTAGIGLQRMERPDAITQRTEGTLKVSTSTYRTRDRAITAEFVEGVLVRFTITSP